MTAPLVAEGPAAEGFGIYVHWPFCARKCPYCDFNSRVAATVDHDRWRRALLAELGHFAATTPGRVVTSVFFGGGTPSLMEPETVAAVLGRIGVLWPAAPDVEVTLEANPGTVDSARFAALRAAGVGRLSLGVQALDDDALRQLGRIHGAAEALAAIEAAGAVFPRLSFDLIYARPGQDLPAWRAELRRALALGPEHLSLYQLTIEPGTAFATRHARGELVLPDEDAGAALYELTQEEIAAAGLVAYEISNHARPGAECRHNLTYWRGGDYVGVGPGAHGRLTEAGRVWALRQHRAPEAWLAQVEAHGHATRERVPVGADDRCAELLLMGLRLLDGVERAAFARLAGRALEEALVPGAVAALEGFVVLDERGLRVTPAGRLTLDAVLRRLLV